MGDSVKISASVTSRRGMGKAYNDNDFYVNGKFLSKADVDNTQATFENNAEDFVFAVCNSMCIEDVQDNTSVSVVGELKKLHEKMKQGRGDIKARLNQVCQCVEEANSLIYSISLNNKDNRRNEAAFSGLVVNKHTAAALSIGDSNAYIFRSGQFKKLILDREKPDRLLKMGIINEDQARTLARNVGPSLHESLMGAQVSDIISLSDNDIFILCSQKLENFIDEDILGGMLLSEADTGVISDMIIKETIKNGVKDDITVLVARVDKVYGENDLDPEQESHLMRWSDKLMAIYDKKQEFMRTFIVAALSIIIIVGMVAVVYKMLNGSGKDKDEAVNAYNQNVPTIKYSSTNNQTVQTQQNAGASTTDAKASTQANANGGTKSTASNQKTGTLNANSSTNGSGITYKVEKGDTLESISKKFYNNDPTKANKIAQANNIKDPSKLKIGQVLIIP